MEKQTIPTRKHRVHRILFETGSPFRARTVENKRKFKRTVKHPNKEIQ
jgi:hypothetical protein